MSNKQRKIFRVGISVALVAVLGLGLLAPLVSAANIGSSGDFVKVSESEIQGNTQSAQALQNSYKSALNRYLTEFTDKAAKNSGEYELVLAYGRVLVNANWFTNNYYTYDEAAKSLLETVGGQVDTDAITSLNKIPGLPIDIQGVMQNPDPAKGKIDGSAFNKVPGSITNDSLVGYNGYQEALAAILNEYIEKGILETLTANNIELDDKWVIGEGNTTVPQEMINALSPVKSYLAPYASLYNQLFSNAYGASLKSLVADEEVSDDQDQTLKHKVVGFTRSDKFLDFVATEVDPHVLMICTWLSADTSEESAGPQQQQEGINRADLSSGALKALANASVIDGVVVSEDGKYELTELGYYVLAAGIVYDPFVSIAGNDTYMNVLKYFMKETDKADELIQTLQVAVNTKKPLYVAYDRSDTWTTEGDLEAIDIATYHTAFLQDMLDDESRYAKAYAMLKGEMRASVVDSATWVYVSKGTGTSSGDSASAEINPDADAATGEVTPGGITSPGSYQITGSQELLATNAQVTVPVAYTSGTRYHWTGADLNTQSLPRKVGGLTTTVIVNAAKDTRDNEYIQRADREMLFMNGLGDIVLSNGIVVLPAIANPALYEYTAEADSEVKDENEGAGAADADSYVAAYVNLKTGYYPYSAAFLNHYPVASYSTTSKVQVTNKNDEDKYIVSANGAGTQATRIKNSGKEDLDVMDISTLPCVPVASGTFSVREDATDTEDLMPYLEMPQSFGRGVGSFFNHIGHFGEMLGFDGGTAGEESAEQNKFSKRFLQTFIGGVNAEKINYFPVIEPDADLPESFLQQVAPLITSAVRYIGTRDSMNALSSSGKFRVEPLITDFIGQAIMGTQYAEQLVKNNQLSYEDMVADQYNRFTRMIKSGVSEVLDTVGHIDGVLAVKDGYGNGFFNVVMNFVQDFYLVIVVLLLIIVASKFIKGRFSLFYVAAIGVVSFAAFNVYAVWMPTAVPAAYNFFVNDIVEEVTWNTVATTAEKYQQTYLDANSKDATSGKDRPYTATITLYKMTQAEMESAAERLNINPKDIKTGEMIYLDRPAGIYIQGDQIKMSIDSLLANNTMRGLYKSQWEAIDSFGVEEVDPITIDTNDNPYIIKLTAPYVSLEAYYTPFCHFERAFLVNLNNFANIFRVERNYYQYPGGLYKDAFLFNAYTDSGIFTAPGDDDILARSILPDQILGNALATPEDIIRLCHQYLDPMEDWLNLLDVFAAPNEAMRTSLWGQALVNAGYYNADWTCDAKQQMMIGDLVTYINEQTKQFVIRNQGQLNFLSDENAIKLVTLYATTCFTHRVSSFGYWLYPNYINASDIELVDVLYGAMTTFKDRNAALDGDIVNTVVLNMGMVGALLILAITLVSVVFVLILTYMVPVLYGMFGFILIWKLVNDDHSISLVKGYAKVTLVSTLLYVLYSCGLRLVKVGGYQWYGYTLCLLISVLCLYFLLYVVMSVVSSPLDMGNEVLARNLFGAADRLTRGRLGQITSNVMHVHSRNTQGYGASGYRGFMRNSPVDDYRYGGSRRHVGGFGFERYDDLDDSTLRGRLVRGIGSVMGMEGSTNVGYRSTRRRGPFGRSAPSSSGNIGADWGDRFDNFRHRSRR